MPEHRGQRQTLTAVAAGAAIAAGYCRLHAFQIRNTSGADAIMRAQGSLVEEYDPVSGAPANMWSNLGAADTTIVNNAVGFIVISDTPLCRIRLNVTTLAGAGLDVRYLGVP